MPVLRLILLNENSIRFCVELCSSGHSPANEERDLKQAENLRRE